MDYDYELYEGIYEQILDEGLASLLAKHPELKPILRKIDDEAAPHTYTQFVSQLLQQALRILRPESRIPLLNRLIELLSAQDGLEYVQRRRLLSGKDNLLTQISRTGKSFPRPETPLATSTLLTGVGTDPTLEHELRREMETSDRVDIIVSFIKWSGLRLLKPGFKSLIDRGIQVRILSTSYMGASDPAALEWLAQQPKVEVRVSYDSSRTRLHAKAYHFVRKSGFSTAYIGSANMSHSAMTQGLEWTVKVTAQDLPHIIERFSAEFETYWRSLEFEPFSETDFDRFRTIVRAARTREDTGLHFFAEIQPHPFQVRILEALEAARINGSVRNLVVAATGTGKTVVSAFDYQRFARDSAGRARLLFAAHRMEILQQARDCFRTVLRDQNFGELLVEGHEPEEWRHVFASVQSLRSRQPWKDYANDYFHFVVVDEAHHGTASSYRPLLDNLKPDILLGLTATPERMDGSSILPDFDGRFAAEIRLPEALEEKLLCPFHYFGVSDNINLDENRFWKNGRYDTAELEKIYTGDHIRARHRVNLIFESLERYQPDLGGIRGVGFCAGVRHARFMADCFRERGIPAEVIVGETPAAEREAYLRAFRSGELPFLFARDVLSEGVDVPEINLVMFLRPTESLTVFLQQLGRGLRHAPEKECLTVLDFVGQTHRRYRIDTKYSALLLRRRQRIDREIERDFPNLPPGCSIQLERVARDVVLEKIRTTLNNLRHFIPETLQTWEHDTRLPLTFGRFVEETGLSPIDILKMHTWSEWKAGAFHMPAPADPDIAKLRKALPRIALRTDPELLKAFEKLSMPLESPEFESTGLSKAQATALHYLMWGSKAPNVGVSSLRHSFAKWQHNQSIAQDAAEIAQWRRSRQPYPLTRIQLPGKTELYLHAAYGSAEIKAFLGISTLEKTGPTGVGVIHLKSRKTYVHLITFRKEERDFTPTTLYQDYPISRTRLHWESQVTATRDSMTGRNYRDFKHLGYTILFFARLEKNTDGETAPFIFLGPAKKWTRLEGDRPITIVWELQYPMPAELFENARPA